MITATEEDLGRLRDIAERGHGAPLLGGWHLTLWGSAIAAALLVHWAVIERILPWPGYALAISWFGLVLTAWLLSALLGRRLSGRPAASAMASQVEQAVWVTAGIFLTLLAATLFAHASVADSPAGWQLFAIMPPVGFGIYAVALSASAAVAHLPVLRRFAWLGLFFAAATALLIGEPMQFPVAAAGILLVAVPPGVLQLRAERAAA